ncbi:DUF374 domain-containing protein [Gudongella oleilytica]|uniref:DUF374 domain-containing protein n=1 Tax=Gudongella oleilytica TaxID=1582259 RepID=UPI002A369C57|nr:DUF374 domain-containing protein [Gudongella oleilytica]MDY0257879.1 DUF374 domain-containing protein [Gudongella oleilytica]
MRKTAKDRISDIVSTLMYKYINFVYRSSKIIYIGFEKIQLPERVSTVFAFWHGDSYSLYPALVGKKLLVITTQDRRGDFISDTCHKFDYDSYRMPDTSNNGGAYVLGLVRAMSEDSSDLAISLDGPLGPYHIPKVFPFAVAYLLKRSVTPISIDIEKKLILKNRWDNFKIPLPYNNITVTFHNIIIPGKNDKAEDFKSIIDQVMKYS